MSLSGGWIPRDSDQSLDDEDAAAGCCWGFHWLMVGIPLAEVEGSSEGGCGGISIGGCLPSSSSLATRKRKDH